jgi:hypothetical protein
MNFVSGTRERERATREGRGGGGGQRTYRSSSDKLNYTMGAEESKNNL